MPKGSLELLMLIQLLTAPDARIFAPSLDIRGSEVLTDKRLISLTIKELITFDIDKGYRLTLSGEAYLDEVFTHPEKYCNETEWVTLVRQGIDKEGHQTTIERAVTSTTHIITPETPPYEEIIDLIDECLDMEIDAAILGIDLSGVSDAF